MRNLLVVLLLALTQCLACSGSVDYVHHIYSTAHDRAVLPTAEDVHCHAEDCLPNSWLGDDRRHHKHGHQLVGTGQTQQLIWKHQQATAAECETKKFLVHVCDEPFESSNHGIGSTLHIATWALAKAMDTGRILIFAPFPDGIWTQGQFCTGHDNLFACYFEPPSTCSYSDVARGLNVQDIPLLNNTAEQENVRVIRSDVKYILQIQSERDLVPSVLNHSLQQSPIPAGKFYFWFRAQAVAFFIRPSRRTWLELDQRKKKQAWANVPQGAISVHIRHGDKGSEMRLIADADYARKAEELVARYSYLKRVIFLSTEDPESIEYFKALGNWTVLTVQVPRPSVGIVVSPMKYAQQIGSDEEMLNSLLNLDLALACSAWVGTIASNWNRLIEELRSTVRCKAHLPYVDAHVGWEVNDYSW